MRIRRRPTRHLYRLRIALVATGMNAVLACVPVCAQTPQLPPPVSENLPHDVYLEVELNGQRSSVIAQFRELNGHLAATGKDLGNIGLALDRLGIADTAEVQLDSIPGLHYTYDAARQTVSLHVPDTIRKPYTFDTRAQVKTPPATSSRGLLINYDAYAQSNTDSQLAIWSEERYFDPTGVFSNTGIMYLYRNDRRYTRYDTSWSMSDPVALNTTQFGDAISSSLAWSRSVRIGGFQWRSNFALRPDLVTFPVPAFAGSAVVPSSVDLYINSVRQYSGNVPSGPFIVSNVPGITGGGQTTVITRDALGRTVETLVPLYVDTRLLATGLTSYSFEAGFLRRAYGLDSFRYDPNPAVSASARHGVNDYLTLEAHAEATRDVYNAGAGALVRLGMAGVVNGSLAASTGRLAGTQASLGYDLIEPYFSITAQTIRAFGNYGDLAASDGTPVPTATDRVTLAIPFFNTQTLSLNYIGFKYPQARTSQIGSVSYTLNVGNLASVNVSAYQDFRRRDSRGAFISVSFGLGNNTSVNTTVGRQNGQRNYNVNASRSPDYDGGWGWGVQAGDAGSAPYRQAQVQYLGKGGEVTVVGQDINGQGTASLDLSGTVVLMDGSVQPSRRIYDGFALVSTDSVAGIPVLHENRLIGTTDRAGYLLVPDLNSYQDNRVGIDSMKLPADARIATTTMNLVPQAQSGVLAHFGVTRYSAASVLLQGPDGKLLPPGASVRHEESGKETIVGYDGLSFIEGLQKNNHLVIDSGALHCRVSFPYTRPGDGTLPTIGPLTCLRHPGDTR